MDDAGATGPDDAGRPTPPAQRPWQHPSEVGHECRVHADRRRGRLLVVGVVAVGAGALLAAALLARQDRGPVSSADAEAPMGRSLARVEMLDGTSTQPVTGVVIDRAGHVVVSESLLGNASTVRVHCDGTYSEATVVASDPVSDLAVLEMSTPAGGPPSLDDTLRPSEPLTLVSFSEDGDRWMRQVVIDGGSAQAELPNGSVARDLLAASGASVAHGVLTDDRGRLAGWVMAASGNQVMAYPPRQVMRLARHLLDEGHVPRRRIGVRAATVDPANGPTGAEVLEVEPDGPAASTLRAGDVIVSLQAEPVTSLGDLVRGLDKLTPGSTVTVVVRRPGPDGALHDDALQLATARIPA